MIHIGSKRSKRDVMPAALGQEAGGRNDRLFYTGMSIASLIAVFVGFAPTYYLRGYFGAPPLTPGRTHVIPQVI